MIPLLQERFSQNLKSLFDAEAFPNTVAVAVSGGSDSMALCLLLQKWCLSKDISLVALTVNHGLRAEAADEAMLVKAWLNRHGIDHRILTRTGPKPEAGVQEFARDARYQLLFDECKQIGVSMLFVGHQQEDHQETFLMRLSKGSGLSGLSGMSLKTERKGIDIIRPLLSFTRAELRAYLQELGQDWIEDPSNESPEYTRTELGHVMGHIRNLPGSSAEAIALSLKRIQRAEVALQTITETTWQDQVRLSPFGFISMQTDFLQSLPDEIGVRVLAKAVHVMRGAGFRVKLQELENIIEKMKAGVQEPFATLSGCQFQVRSEEFLILREPGRDGLPVTPMCKGRQIIWDERFSVTDHKGCDADPDEPFLEVRVLGDSGWQQLQSFPVLTEIEKLPAIVRKNLPGVWSGEKLVSAPLISAESLGLGIANDRFEMVFIHTLGSE